MEPASFEVTVTDENHRPLTSPDLLNWELDGHRTVIVRARFTALFLHPKGSIAPEACVRLMDSDSEPGECPVVVMPEDPSGQGMLLEYRAAFAAVLDRAWEIAQGARDRLAQEYQEGCEAETGLY